MDAQNNAAQQEKHPSKGLGSTLYSNSSQALNKVQEDFLYWTEKLTDNSFNLSLAVIGANWAVFGTVDKVMQNLYARASIAIVLIGLGINLIGTKLMSEQHRARVEYAEADPARWEREFKETHGRNDPWPYTKKIETLGRRLRFAKTWLPILGGALFLFALL
jgi:hypothetical protein